MQQPIVLSITDQVLVLLLNCIFCANEDMHRKNRIAEKRVLFTISINDGQRYGNIIKWK